MDEDVTCTTGLQKCLTVRVGAKVMLKRNISVIAGLVNGATGPVTGFNGRPINNELNITSVNVWFENAPQSVQIERQSTTSEVPNSVYHTQKQFLLILAFAITIHKSQGLSMKTAIVDAGPNCFRIGMM